MVYQRRVYCLSLLLIACAALRIAFAASSIPLKATWHNPFTFGVFSDGNDVYQHNVVYVPGKQSVRCYFGVNAKNVVLVTYMTGRTLHFVPRAEDLALFKSVGIKFNKDANGNETNDFNAEVDLFATNDYGQFTAIGLGKTAKVHADLEFHQPDVPLTFELHYSSLAAQKTFASPAEWLITSDVNDPLQVALIGFSGVAPIPVADLNVVRRRSQENFGQVTMPISFTVTCNSCP